MTEKSLKIICDFIHQVEICDYQDSSKMHLLKMNREYIKLTELVKHYTNKNLDNNK